MENILDFNENYIYRAYYEINYRFVDERIANICTRAGHLLAKSVMLSNPIGLVAGSFTNRRDKENPDQLSIGFGWYMDELEGAGIAFEHTTVNIVGWLGENGITNLNLENVDVKLIWQNGLPQQSIYANLTEQAEEIKSDVCRFREIQPGDFL